MAHILYAVRLGEVFDLLIKHFIYYSGNERNGGGNENGVCVIRWNDKHGLCWIL
ncbi:hypothetical protein HP552_26880 [Paenibacillus xylanilyticus]|uniref:Uncharacterized protein n=1 Tax=Paenibacillus xylanilyticus TaxID=248903 RepID=A0A7Y6C1F4_9BACL|nr:hypothetical protein [Paenibacillus xylanilyticus]